MVRFLTMLSTMSRDAFSDPIRRLQLSLGTLLLLTLFGTVMYMWIEDWQFGDAMYMTIITIATVGFGEVRQLSPEGRWFTIVLILLGVGAATSAISNAVSLALEPVLWTSLQTRRMQRLVKKMDKHYIVCGYGRMGRQIVCDLQARDEPFVVVDSALDNEQVLFHEEVPYVIGDATRDDVLYEAGIERAAGFVAALNDDASNIMTVLTARELNPKLFIVARVVRQESESKLYRAGADRVINPYLIGGHRMALTLLRPAVHDFLEHIFHFGESGQDVDIGQITVHEHSRLAGQTVGTCDLRRVHHVNILAIKQPDGELITTPPPDTPLHIHAVLVVIGPPEAIYTLEQQNLKAKL